MISSMSGGALDAEAEGRPPAAGEWSAGISISSSARFLLAYCAPHAGLRERGLDHAGAASSLPDCSGRVPAAPAAGGLSLRAGASAVSPVAHDSPTARMRPLSLSAM